MAAASPGGAADRGVPDGDTAVAEKGALRLDACVEQGERDQRFEDGARGVDALKRPVDERPFRVVEQRLVVFPAEDRSEFSQIVGRIARGGENVAVGRVEQNECSPFADEQ